MPSSVLDRVLVIALFTFSCSVAAAKDMAPQILQEPVLGLRYEIAKTRLDALSPEVIAHCPTMDNENVRGRYWVFAFARDAARAYYVIGGYGIRSSPRPPDYPRFVPYDFGSVFFLEGDRCTDLGSAREVFEAGAFGEDMPQSILQKLASDLAVRLTIAFGGPDRLRTELRNQHIDPDRLPLELSDVFSPYLHDKPSLR